MTATVATTIIDLGRIASVIRAVAMLCLLCIGAASTAFAAVESKVDGLGLTDFTVASSSSYVAGAGMMNTIGSTLNQLANMLSGPVLWIVVGVAIVLAVYGFASGKMAMAFTGCGALLLAAILKTLFGKLTSTA